MLFRVFRETRGYTTSNLITTEGLMTWSSEVFRILSSRVLKWKSYKKRKLKEVFCVVFRSLKKTRKKVCVLCSQLFAISSVAYVSKIVWFWYDYGMVVWKWYDCMTSVWWFVSCVCEWVQLKKLQTVVNKVHTVFLVFFKLRNITQSTSLSFRFLQLFHIRKWLDIPWRPLKTRSSNLQSWLGLMLCILVYPWRPWRAKVFFFILSFINNI